MIATIFLLLSFTSFSKNNTNIDSLESLDFSMYHDSVVCDIYNQLADRHKNLVSRENYAIKLLELSKNKYPIWEFRAYLSLGNIKKFEGSYNEALDHYFNGLKIAEDLKLSSSGIMYLTIADVFKATNNFKNASNYYQKALTYYGMLSEKSRQDSLYIAAININRGDMFLMQEMYDSAKYNFENARKIGELLKNQYYLAVIKGNEALVMAALGNDIEAIDQLNETIEALSARNNWSGATEFLIYMSDIYLKKGNVELAKDFALKTYKMSKEHSLKDRIEQASFTLYEINQRQGDYKKALEFHKEYTVYKDSTLNSDVIQDMADLKTEFEVGQKQAEVDLLTAEKKTQQILLYASTGGAILLLALVGLIYKNNRDKSRINAVLADQKSQLEELNKTKDKFFSIISHDLRGPVHAFSGISRLIKYSAEDDDKEGLVEIAEHVEKTSKDLSGMLDGMLEWAMQQQGKMEYKPQQVSVKSIFEGVHTLFTNSAKAKNIQLQLDVDSEALLWVDKNSIHTIFRNLINNAIKFTPEGGAVSASVDHFEDHVEIKISDTGIGIPEGKLAQLFNQVGSKSSYGTDGEKGLGLGLQLVYEFVKMNHGTIEVDSEEGKGTVFIIQLPMSNQEAIA
ncbi:MAG: HAMP domain-containing sensor histidine kinase [Fulvivirga sp.]|uniref:tetratricopeptide repeat-containing sensor histidine kinase n=1 Tax=Fulvivirga sp. TaxID=1931237 RepID=UPI0032ECDB10